MAALKYTTQHLTRFQLELEFPGTAEQLRFKSMLERIEMGKLKGDSFKTMSIYDTVEKFIPFSTIVSNGYEISIFRHGMEVDYMSSSAPQQGQEIPRTELFTTQRLDTIDANLNYVAALMIGTLGFNPEEIEVLAHIYLNRDGKLTKDFNFLLKENMLGLFGDGDNHMTGIQITSATKENNLPITTELRLHHSLNKVIAEISQRFKYPGIIDSSGILDRMISHTNRVAKNLECAIIE